MAILYPPRLADTFAAIYHAEFVEQKEVHTLEAVVPILQNVFGEESTKEILSKVDIEVMRKMCPNHADKLAVNKRRDQEASNCENRRGGCRGKLWVAVVCW